jgi:hypothetical protein
VDYKQEIGDWLLQRLQKSLAAASKNFEADSASDSLTLWALGRIGAREPLHGTSHEVVPAEVAASWIQTLLALDWKQLEAAAFAAVHLARVTDDRTRDLPAELREHIAMRLQAVKAPPIWVEMVQKRVALDAATERRVFGESLPPGLKLMA